MPLLLQQELVEPAPPKRLIVPVGCGAWWGIDPSTRRVALSGVLRGAGGGLDRWVATRPFAASEGAQRLSEIHSEVVAFMREQLAVRAWPGVVLIEQPSGKTENPALSYAVGVTIAAVHRALEDHARVVPVRLVPSSSWKKQACGYGRIYKPKRGGPEYGVLTWARENGYVGSSWDEADAWAIAEAARRTYALDER